MEPIPVSQHDYLDQDPEIRGQSFVCLSFIAPEDVQRDKEVFLAGRFLKRVGEQIRDLLKNLKEKYPTDADLINTITENHSHLMDEDKLQEEFRFFREQNSYVLEKEFHEMKEFRTTVRGIKVRGCYDTLKEAENRANYLKKRGDIFDIYVAQVGCWCPWPSPDYADKQEYATNMLNTLMKTYKDNQEEKDRFFQNRKEAALKAAAEGRKESAKVSYEIIPEANPMDEVDPWMKRKIEQQAESTESTESTETAAESPAQSS